MHRSAVYCVNELTHCWRSFIIHLMKLMHLYQGFIFFKWYLFYLFNFLLFPTKSDRSLVVLGMFYHSILKNIHPWFISIVKIKCKGFRGNTVHPKLPDTGLFDTLEFLTLSFFPLDVSNNPGLTVSYSVPRSQLVKKKLEELLSDSL